jgi:two-component sensor histidine kinase
VTKSTLFPSLGSQTKHTIDFSLVPAVIILIEFSVLITQLASSQSTSFGDLFLLRLIHTVTMISISMLVSQIYIWTKRPALSFRTLAITGVLVLALGDLTHSYLASSLAIELVDFYRRVGIVAVQGVIWFPAIMLVLGYRKEIIRSFQDYKQRLIIETRLRSRTSRDFQKLGKETRAQIRQELYEKCKEIRDSIAKISISSETLAHQAMAIRDVLAGDGLRQFSRRLESFEAIRAGRFGSGYYTNSLFLLFQQFRILYASTLRSAPLGKWAYIFVLIGIAIPPFLYFHSFAELLFSIPILLGAAYVSATIVTKVQASDSPGARRLSSVMVFLTGLLPFATDSVWQLVFGDPRTQVPVVISAVALPIAYVLFMEIFQVLRPSALLLIETNQLRASKALQKEVLGIVSNEFQGNLSHQWAVYIHGKILTRLASISLKLDSASKAEDTQAFGEALQTLTSLLSAPDAEFEEESKDLQAELKSRIEPWSGLLTITLSISPDLKSIQSPRVKDLGQVVEELISNSIRHGKATRIDLKISHSEGADIQITALDDATVSPSESANNAGLGTRIFNLASDGRWSIAQVGSSTEFRLTMGMDS